MGQRYNHTAHAGQGHCSKGHVTRPVVRVDGRRVEAGQERGISVWLWVVWRWYGCACPLFVLLSCMGVDSIGTARPMDDKWQLIGRWALGVNREQRTENRQRALVRVTQNDVHRNG